MDELKMEINKLTNENEILKMHMSLTSNKENNLGGK